MKIIDIGEIEMKEEIEINGVTYVPKGSEVTKKVPVKKGLTYCIVRTYSAGVFAGYVDRKTKTKEKTVFEARRLWYWDGASSLSELAVKGVAKPDKCKFPLAVSEIDLTEVIEILPCTTKAKDSIVSVKEWKQHD